MLSLINAMQRHVFLTLILFMLSFNVAYADIRNGRIGHWLLDEGSGSYAYNSSGGTNTGTLYNTPTWTTGQFVGALSFDGVNEYVGIPNDVTGIRTVSFWMKPAASEVYPLGLTQNREGVVSKWGYFSGGTCALTRYVNGTAATETLGSEKLSNRSFTTDLSLWSWANGASAVRDTVDYYSSPASAKVTTAAGQQNNFYQTGLPSLTAGALYKYSFWAKGSTSAGVAPIIQEWGTFAVIYLPEMALTTGWLQYTYYFFSDRTTSSAYLNFQGPATAISYWVDDLSLKEVTGDSASVTNDTWNHYVIVTDAAFSAESMSFGRVATNLGTYKYLTGSIDDVRFYNRALTATEVGELNLNKITADSFFLLF